MSLRFPPPTSIALAVGVLTTLAAQAQTAPAPAASSASAPAGVHSLSTVVVSGPRATGFTSNVVGVGAFRDQAPVDVPLTNSVVTREVLDAQGAKSVMDALRNTAGVTRSQTSAASYDNLAIRGVVMENRSSYRLDGSLPLVSLVAIPLEDKERVEVLKGASSMYYGMVPPAGIVNFEMKRAGPRPVTAFGVMVNEYGGHDVTADVGRRFGDGDRFGLRVNLVDGKDQPGLHNYHGRRDLKAFAFDFRVLDNLTFKADYEMYSKNATEQAAVNLIGTATVLPRAPDNRSNLGPDSAILAAKASNKLAKIEWGVTENWNLTAEYGEAFGQRNRAFPSFTFASGGSATQPTSYVTGAGTVSGNFLANQTYQNKNARLDLSGRIETGPVAHEVTIGYTRNTRAQDSNNTRPAGLPASAITYGPLAQNLFSPIALGQVAATGSTLPATSVIVDKGFYAVDRIIVSQQLHVMVGMRHTSYFSANLSPTYGNVYSTSENSPNVSVIFKPTPDSSIYASRLKGLEAGQGVPSNFLNTGTLLPAADTTQTEVGYKHQLAGLLLQGALFNIDRAQTTSQVSNLCGTQAQITAAAPGVVGVAVPNPNGSGTLLCALNSTQDGRARYRGLELAASGEINRHIGIVASALLMNPKITRDSTPGSTNTQGHLPGNTAKQTFSLFGEYRFDTVPGWSVNAGAYYTGRRAAANSNNVFLPSFTLFSLGTRYKTKLASTTTTFQLNVDNLANRNYWSSADATSANPIIASGLPRMIRAAATVEF